MFKKTLAAVAVLGAFAGSAFAANVTMYGIIDTGLGYTSTDKGYGEDVNKFDMRSGQNSASRFGVKGEEDLGNGLKVGFSLENGFNSDDGQLATEGRLFDREALLYVGGDFGELGMGRQGELASGNGRYGLFGGKVSPFSTGWSDIAGHKYVMGAGFGRMDNTITYKTPTFAGFNLLAQYSFDKNVKKDDDKIDTGVQHGREGSAETDRQYALGVTFAAGDLYLAGIVTQTNKQSVKFDGQSLGKQDDPLTVSLGVVTTTSALPSSTLLASTSRIPTLLSSRSTAITRIPTLTARRASSSTASALPSVLTFPPSAVRPRPSSATWMPTIRLQRTLTTCSAMPSLSATNIRSPSARSSTAVPATTLTPMTRSPLVAMTRLPSPLSTPVSSTSSNNCPFA